MDSLRALLIVLASVTSAQLAFAADVLPQPAAPFKGKIGPTVKESIPDWPQPVHAPQGAPNIVLILLDDVGFGAAGTFGGPVQTPQLDKLASDGLRYNRFHVSAQCSPTRAALLSGRNDHRVGFGVVTDISSGFPGYNGVWKKEAVSIAEVLRRNGYSTAAFGKWHNTPYWEISPVGPFDHWPTGLGFEYFYGFMGAEDSQWDPSLYRNTTPVDPPKTPEEGYHFTTDIADEAINWLHTHESLEPLKPYFLYFATGATHGPQQVPKEWIERYRGHFDRGWDELRKEIFARQKKLGVIPAGARLTLRPKELPAWNSFSADEQKLLARQMEVFAGFMAQTDYEVGRLIDAVRQAPGGTNTLVMYIVGDNGPDEASGRLGLNWPGGGSLQEQLRRLDELGGPSIFNNYATGWAWATAAPFQWGKHIASHLGGTRDPLIVSWPARIKDRGGLRSQFSHVTDVAATVYEVTGIRFPSVVDGVEQLPLDGVSLADTFDDAKAPSRHRMQVFEQMGNRAIYRDGWIAAARHTVPWVASSNNDFSRDRWELYNLDEDFSEARDLARRYPQKLRELQALFDVEARKNDIYPLNPSVSHEAQSKFTAEQTHFSYYPGLPRLPPTAAPDFSRSHRIVAEVGIPENSAQGVIISDESRSCGFTLYVKDNHLVYENHFADKTDKISSQTSLPYGKVELAYQFSRHLSRTGKPEEVDAEPGVGTLYVNGQVVAEEEQGPVMTCGTLGIGQTFGPAVSGAFQPPFKFNGVLNKVTVELK